jgi:hypothetical protein
MKKSLLFLLIAGLVLPLVVSGTNAQQVKLEKWVIGSGGMVGATNSEKIQMSGVVGQLAIEKISVKSDIQMLDVYQGFWVPKGTTGTSIEDPLPPGASDITNYPNPVNNSTTFRYTLPGMANVTITVYDVNGKRIGEVFNGVQSAGEQQIKWSAVDNSGLALTAGSYVYELNVDAAQLAASGFKGYTLRKLMVVVK